MQDTPELLRRLLRAHFDMVLVGDVAAIVHGSARFTQDLGVLAPLTLDNLQRLHEALAGTEARHRPAETEPLRPPERLVGFKNLYLSTTFGELDVLGSLGVLAFAEVLSGAEEVLVPGLTCRVISLEHLIESKEYAGRPKDREAVLELRALQELRDTP